MKKTFFPFFALLSLLLLVSCNDYDSAAIGYDDVVEDSVVYIEEPVLDAAWKLAPIMNIGQNSDKIFLYRDELYNALFSRTLGWNGGDILSSAALSGNRVLWLARDSYFGVVDAATRARLSSNTVRCGMLLQTSAHGTLGNPASEDLKELNALVQTSDPAAEGYYEGVNLAVAETTKSYLVPALASEKDGKIQVLYGCYKSSNSRREATYLGTYTLGSDGTLVEESLLPNMLTNMIGYDNCLLRDDDGHNYIYCTYLLTGVSGVLVARTSTYDLGSTWEYCVRNIDGDIVWTETAPTTASGLNADEVAMRSSMLANNGACQHPQVLKRGKYYYLIGQSYQNGQDVLIWRSATPYGPFTDVKTLCVIPSRLEKKGPQTYNSLTRVTLHNALSREGELVLSTTQTAPATADNFTYPGSADYVRPYFYRVYNWESLWD
ncbi:MAG: DUF5005 domain-containing protein [Bacteroidaceae bacterium]|nr:DUF5005 domain-containing protein [Bacteroidaceae bacterium]